MTKGTLIEVVVYFGKWVGEKMKNTNHKGFCTTVYYDKHIQLLNVPNRHGYNLAFNLKKGG